MTQVAYQINERRNKDILKHDEHWDLTTADQKLALYDLHRFGYRLLFVRHMLTGPVAVISQQDDIAAIYADGEVDLRPKITLRDIH
ncbi:hypothetical protein [Shewanella ulleungensis]|jgi:hypothetical protein|uniref:DUF4224 domain-containing protein n=1 Tax=Shewanella ulleungensis TaxID=2282699 RepID=A0ABQ2QM69_9GAMM|nr:hypothetical protein [Shewanella ulleungensis]MCL1150453.1 hypothetical protein [Shewanella ulleungensis]GGP87538.1 hypothetical protein GCM10009410_21410 [Shewanella ulleungensis]